MSRLPKFLCILLSLLIASFLPSCTKEYSVEGAIISGISGGTALYRLDGSGGNCPGVQVNGLYNVNVRLQSSDNIILAVNVATPGTYALTTAIVNGIQFSGAGNLIHTGEQTITLTANGIPREAGVFTFIPPVDQGCAFQVVVAK